MDITGEYKLALRRQVVWRALNDPAVLRRCIPGCEELEQIDAESYRAKVKMAIGPVNTTFETKLSITDATPPARYRLQGEGQGGAVGFGRGQAVVELSETDRGTLLKYSADFQVGGRLAQLGSRLVVGVSRRMADDFFARLAADIDPGAEPGERVAGARASARRDLRRSYKWVAAALFVTAATLWWWSNIAG